MKNNNQNTEEISEKSVLVEEIAIAIARNVVQAVREATALALSFEEEEHLIIMRAQFAAMTYEQQTKYLAKLKELGQSVEETSKKLKIPVSSIYFRLSEKKSKK